MKPVINKTEFGSITVDEERYDHDIMITLDGKVKKRKKKLSNEASEFLKNKHCKILLRPTPEAIQEWNKTEGNWIGLFHITC